MASSCSWSRCGQNGPGSCLTKTLRWGTTVSAQPRACICCPALQSKTHFIADLLYVLLAGSGYNYLKTSDYWDHCSDSILSNVVHYPRRQ